MEKDDPKRVDELAKSLKEPKDLLGKGGLIKQPTAALVGRILDAELAEHLGYEKEDPAGCPFRSPGTVGATSHPSSSKAPEASGGFRRQGALPLARGVTLREFQGHLHELTGVEVSPDLISRATEAVWEEASAWQSRPIDPVWPIVYLNALMMKVRDHGGGVQQGGLPGPGSQP